MHLSLKCVERYLRKCQTAFANKMKIKKSHYSSIKNNPKTHAVLCEVREYITEL